MTMTDGKTRLPAQNIYGQEWESPRVGYIFEKSSEIQTTKPETRIKNPLPVPMSTPANIYSQYLPNIVQLGK